MEALTALGLSASAGLNAYIPMLVVGLIARFTSVIDLPSGWRWLENPWALGVIAVLLAVEIVADKVPVVDHVNDVLQTVIRPSSGGIVVSAAAWGGQKSIVSDPHGFITEGGWIPLLTGAGIALAVHLGKAALRGLANTATAGLAAPVLSTVEDGSSLALALAAVLLPVLVLVLLVVMIVGIVRLRRRARERRLQAQAAPPPLTA